VVIVSWPPGCPVHDDRHEVRARGVQRGGESRRARTDDQQIDFLLGVVLAGDSEHRVQLPLVVERLELFESADAAVADENLRRRRPAAAATDHLIE